MPTAKPVATTRAVIYVRVSSDPTKRWRSVAEQEAECREVAEQRGWEVVGVYCDNDRSASQYATRSRPEYERMKLDLEHGLADVLLTWEASRGTRDLEEYAKLRKLCATAGVMWAYDGQLFDLTDARDRRRTAEDAVDAEHEADKTRERVLRAMRANASAGAPHGRIPYGYRREYDPQTRTLVAQVVCDEEAAVIREAAVRFLGGETANAIATDFNRRGIRTRAGAQWTLTHIRRILTNPAYISKRVHQGRIVGDANWPAILDEDTFYACTSRFSDPARKTTHEHAVKHLLSGIARCGLCGGGIKAMPQRGGYMAYQCRVRFCTARKQEWVDAYVIDIVLALLARPEALTVIAPTDDDEVDLHHQLRVRRERLDEFYNAAAEGKITPAALGSIESKLSAEIARIEGSIREKTRHIPAPVLRLANVKDVRRAWDRLSVAQQREVISSLVEIRLLRARPGVRSFDPDSVDVTLRTPAVG